MPELETIDPKIGTKRFGIYCKFVERYLSDAHFVHYPSTEDSSYLLISRKWPDTHQKAVEIRQMIADMYEMEELFA